jgi:hypothetical protein
MTERSTTVVVLMVLAFAAALFLVYTRIIKKPHREVTEVVVCTECHHVFEVTAPLSKGGAPYECTNPACRERSAFLAFQCKNPECRAIFPVRPAQMRRGEKIVCPVCGSQAEVLREVQEDADALAAKAAE